MIAQNIDEPLKVRFRVRGIYQGKAVSVYFDDERIQHKKKRIFAPGQMEEILIKPNDLNAHASIKQIKVAIEDA